MRDLPATDRATHDWVASCIWGIADDVLRDLFKRGQYPGVVLPMCAIRRMDAPLETPGKRLAREHLQGVRAALALFKRLCRLDWTIDPAATAFYIDSYRKMWDSEATEGVTRSADRSPQRRT